MKKVISHIDPTCSDKYWPSPRVQEEASDLVRSAVDWAICWGITRAIRPSVVEVKNTVRRLR